jgi:hypothetical protein
LIKEQLKKKGKYLVSIGIILPSTYKGDATIEAIVA